MEDEYADHMQAYMDIKKYDTKDHKEVAKLVKKNLQAHNYNLTNTELLHFHEVEIVMVMVAVTRLKKKLDQFLFENLVALLINVALMIALFIK